MNDFQRRRLEPSIRHQCMHVNDEGRECRAHAMYNEYFCIRHRIIPVAPVIENEPFEIPHLDDRGAIQCALAEVAARLACNRIDLKRASLLAYTLQVASGNLTAATPRPASDVSFRPEAQSAAAEKTGSPASLLAGAG